MSKRTATILGVIFGALTGAAVSFVLFWVLVSKRPGGVDNFCNITCLVLITGFILGGLLGRQMMVWGRSNQG